MSKRNSFLNQTIRLLIVLIFVSALLLIIRPALPTQAATLVVLNTNDSGAGSLRQAVADAITGDTITFDASLAGDTITLASEIAINKNLTITGSNLSSHVQISGNNTVRVFSVSSGVTVTLDHLDIINGLAPDIGGGIKNEGTLAISNSTVSNNDASLGGGGIFNETSLTISNSTFTGNSASANYGGGIYSSSASVLVISNSTFSDNDAQFGGGIFNATSTSNSGGTVTISGSTFSGNSAVINGGGIYNTASGTLHLKNSIIANSPSGGDCYNEGTLATNINNLIEDGSCSPSVTGDPDIGVLADNGGPTQTMVLGVDSPAIDAGDDAACEATDQRGVPRPQGAHCDIGAYESELFLLVNSLDDPGDGSCTDSECTLREAISSVENDGTITFVKNLEGGVITLGAVITITKDVIIDGSGLTPNVQASGDGSVRVLAVTGGVTVTIDHLDFVDGSADIGGAINNDSGSLLTISNCKFDTNSADDGGAINNNNATLTVTDCTFYNNSAAKFGGAINNHQGTVTVTSSTFYENRSDQFGGGVFNSEGTMTVANSTFYNNDALDWGGGIENYGGTLTVSNSTFSANYVPTANQGGGILNSSNGVLHLKNTIIADSPTGGDCINYGTIATNTNNLIEDGSCSPELTVDPLLGLLADNGGPTLTMALGTGSPAIDAGNDGTCESADQRSVGRPQGAHCDIGAYEFEFYTIYLPLVIK